MTELNWVFWLLFIYGFVAMALGIELIREERHGSFKLKNGKTAILAASAGPGFIWWVTIIYATSNFLDFLEKGRQTMSLCIIMFGSLIVALWVSETILLLIVRGLFKNTRFTSVAEDICHAFRKWHARLKDLIVVC